MRRLALAVLSAVVVLSGCASAPVSVDAVHLPRVAPTPPGLETVWLTASGEGTLVVDRGCLRLRSDSGQMLTLLWHAPFTLISRGALVALRDPSSARTYPIGTYIHYGGGEMSDDEALRNDPIAYKKCGGRFGSAWLGQ